MKTKKLKKGQTVWFYNQETLKETKIENDAGLSLEAYNIKPIITVSGNEVSIAIREVLYVLPEEKQNLLDAIQRDISYLNTLRMKVKEA